MNHLKPSAKPFPLPLVAAGMAVPEDEQLDYLVMPQGMATYQSPSLPEPEDLAGHEAALQALRAVRAQLQAHLAGQPAQAVSLNELSEADRALVNQALGEGEVSARVLEAPGWSSAQIQESVFAGVWRVVEQLPDGRVSDRVEVGPVPQLLLQAAVLDALEPMAAVAAMPPGVMNAPAVLTELRDHRQRWRPGRAAAVVNLSLLPLTPEDARHIEERIGQGRVLILSRGYGNCRISNARVPHTWHVVYYNSQDAVILNSIEVTDLPDVACAAREDLEDSFERLGEVLAWMEQA